jgi:hypothetical protein
MVAVLLCACGPGPGGEDADDGGTDEASSSAVDDGSEGPTVDCSVIDDGVAHGRWLVNGDASAIEVLTEPFGDPQPLACGDALPACDYEIHRLTPAGVLMAGQYTVENGVLVHHVESCSCCNGEGGVPNESELSYDNEMGELVIDGSNDECVGGSFQSRGETIRFVATRC